ncbi:hypothetical protein Taro_041851 [Colocasia esculenta]|uniref:Uncharacterized protein n=1 Tax=Colocasia esculenta TaxID=4460 RepID=A0A843WCH5_COLES|nr:hypothetical protein [Colocasia esculenta]
MRSWSFLSLASRREESRNPVNPRLRGNAINVVITLPWAEVRPWRSQHLPFPCWFLCFLPSQLSQPRSQQSQPATTQRQRGSGNVREPPEDPTEIPGCAERSVHSYPNKIQIQIGIQIRV